jgi:hypothetical protein
MRQHRLGSRIRLALLGLALLAFPAQAAGARQTKFITGPNRERVAVTVERQMVYGLSLFDGGGYQTTFCPKPVNTIYMVAGVDNVVTFRRTEVYFWPLTKEYMANWMELNQNQTGALEIRHGNRVLKTLAQTKFAFLFPESGAKAAAVKTGAAAVAASREFDVRMALYYQQMNAYTQKEQQYQRLVKEYLKNPAPAGGHLPPAPREPQPLSKIISPPDDGFILNLPPGNYRLRFKDRQGKTLAGSKKSLVVFPVRAKGVGYEVIPEDKWTSPVKSDGPGDHLFLRTGQILYLKPFATRQYNRHHFLKLAQLTRPDSGRGVEEQQQWAAVYPLPGHPKVVLVKDGKPVQTIGAAPYIVKQRSGYALGYDIRAYSPGRFPGEKASFTAYRICLPAGLGRYELQLYDTKGRFIAGSRRSIYNIPEPNWAVLLVALLPLCAGVAVKLYRGWLFNPQKEILIKSSD